MRRSAAAVKRDTENVKKLHEQGGEQALRQRAKESADKLWTGKHCSYNSRDEMEEGFFQEALKKAKS